MEPKILKTEAEYQAALLQMQKLMNSRPGSAKADQLELWAKLIDEYENAQHSIPLPDPIEAILFRMEQENLRPEDLEGSLGDKTIVADVLSRKRELTLPMVKILHQKLGIPADVFLNEPVETT